MSNDAQPCRNLTDAECVELAEHINVPLAIVKYVMQDDNYCVWHEQDVHTWEELKAQASVWFDYDWQSELPAAEAFVAQREMPF
jgi:hypothetical protein